MAPARPSISVVIPCLNAEGTLAACLDSMVAQTFEDFEVVVFDDGSDDASPEIAEAYGRRDGRVRVIRSRHVGIVEALRRACSEIRGRFIARMDADDVAHPERLARQIEIFDSDAELMLCGTGVSGIGDAPGSGRERYEKWVNSLVTHEEMARELFVECPIPHPTLMIRSEAYGSAGGYADRGWAEDYDLVMRCAGAGFKMGKVDAPLLQWRRRADRLSSRDPRYSLEQFRALKRHYLGRCYLRGGVAFYQWGAGEVGKAWLREWNSRRPEAVVDVNPRKFGKVIHGIEVIEAGRLPGPGQSFTVVAVGAPGARDDIRAWFRDGGYVELRDYLFVS